MTPFRLSLTALALTAGLFAAGAQAQQSLIPAQSEITFQIKQMNVPVEGRFRTFDAQVAFDPSKLSTSKIVIHIDTGSATLGSKEADTDMAKPVWFNVPKFPQATFTSTQIQKTVTGSYNVSGTMSIKGVVNNVIVPVTLSQSGTVTTASGQLAMQRLNYKIGEGEWADTSIVADPVIVRFKLALNGVGKL